MYSKITENNDTVTNFLRTKFDRYKYMIRNRRQVRPPTELFRRHNVHHQTVVNELSDSTVPVKTKKKKKKKKKKKSNSHKMTVNPNPDEQRHGFASTPNDGNSEKLDPATTIRRVENVSARVKRDPNTIFHNT